MGSYRIKPPLIKPSRLTKRENGGGKDLSSGWVINYAVGCTHGCIFCYVDSIHKRYGRERYGDVVEKRWGEYLLIPSNLWRAIAATPWIRWRGEEVLMSSTHDPYLPQLYKYTRAILERALRAGVKIRLLTRSTLILKDLDLLEKYRDRVIVQVSIATLVERFSRLIEPRVPRPRARLTILEKAKERGLETRAVIAPIFPPNRIRPNLEEDIENIVAILAEIGVDRVYGEILHVRGMNMSYIREDLGEHVRVTEEFDRRVARLFYRLLDKYGLRGEYWPEYF